MYMPFNILRLAVHCETLRAGMTSNPVICLIYGSKREGIWLALQQSSALTSVKGMLGHLSA